MVIINFSLDLAPVLSLLGEIHSYEFVKISLVPLLKYYLDLVYYNHQVNFVSYMALASSCQTSDTSELPPSPPKKKFFEVEKLVRKPTGKSNN